MAATETLTATRTVAGRDVPAAGTWNIDPSHTSITFEGRHMMISKVRGSLGLESGTIIVATSPLASSLEVVMDIASVESGSAERDDHLRSPDFFNVEAYPQMTFTGAGLEATDEGYRLSGELTIKDVSHPVELEIDFTGGVIDPWGNPRVAFSATTTLDREDWGLTWNMALEAGGVLVGKKIKISIDAEAVLAV